ncbi:MAG: FlgD immunoglobulin-like domain containing protein [Candidatus Eisenbacteria bacterium]|uniref:FlgD Ig-like domain-containing protein n=1 Tax=Eiseniibacteriota bacterium TaxID=2212470 RepID=A0A956M0V9_UNCEI|nr:hypothetical protein [Candidatus Eisenbacteria bacterium]
MNRYTAALFLVSVLVVAPAALAATHVVRPDGSGDFPTIGQAMASAASGDTIALADGTFTGAGNRSLNPAGKQLVVRSESGVAASCIIDVQGSPRAFIFDAGEDTTFVLQSFTIANSFGTLSFSGAIFCGTDCSPHISGCIFRDNVGGGAAAVYCISSSQLIVSDCTFVNNSGSSVMIGGSPHISGSTFADNVASSSVLALRNGTTLSNTIIAHNEGKAVGCFETDFTIVCCDIFDNIGGDWIDCIADKLGVDGNISAEPLFCDPTNGDFTLAESSPCAPESNPDCGLIGAWPATCPPACTLELTPGRITTYYPCNGSFSTDLWIDHVIELGSFDLCLGFDGDGLSFDHVDVDSDFLGSTGRTVTPTGPAVCAAACQTDGVAFGAVTSGVSPGPSGNGRLATIFWQPVNVDVSTEGSLCFDSWVVETSDVPPGTIPVSDAPEVSLVHRPFCYGDFNDNGDVSIVDVMNVAVRWGAEVGDQGYDETFDVNLIAPGSYCASVADGAIDVVDVQSVAARWGQGCPESPLRAGTVDPGANGRIDRSGNAAGRNEQAGRGATGRLTIAPEALALSGEVGSTGVFSLELENAPAVGAFEATLVFDASVIQVENVEITSYLGSTGRSVYPLAARIDNETGTLTLGAWSTGEDPGPEGSGALAWVTVSIRSCPGESRFDIARAKLTDVGGWPQGPGETSGAIAVTDCEAPSSVPVPSDVARLLPSRPNPFARSTSIPFAIPASVGDGTSVELLIVDVTGRTIRKLVDGHHEPGLDEVVWDGRDDRGVRVASGTYFCRLLVGDTELRRQLVLVE